jgi:hypothetical protein
MNSFYPSDLEAYYAAADAEPECTQQDAHDYAVWAFQTAARDLMDNHA